MKEFKISFEDYREFNDQSLLSILRSMTWKIALPFVALIILGLTYQNNFKMTVWTFVIVTIMIFGTFMYTRKKSLRKIYDSNKAYQESIQVVFDDEGIRWQTVSGNYKIKWQDMYGYRLFKNMTILYQDRIIGHIIPLRAFENDEEKNRFSKLLEKNVPKQGGN